MVSLSEQLCKKEYGLLHVTSEEVLHF